MWITPNYFAWFFGKILIIMKKKGTIKNLADLKKLSQFLLPFLKPNVYLILIGELGVGKTTLTQLIAKNLGIKKKITSPTFTILQRYLIKNNFHLNHFDFFRLKPYENLEIFQELTFNNLNIIEWGEKHPAFWQTKKYIRLELTKTKSEARIFLLTFSFPTSKEN